MGIQKAVPKFSRRTIKKKAGSKTNTYQGGIQEGRSGATLHACPGKGKGDERTKDAEKGACTEKEQIEGRGNHS